VNMREIPGQHWDSWAAVLACSRLFTACGTAKGPQQPPKRAARGSRPPRSPGDSGVASSSAVAGLLGLVPVADGQLDQSRTATQRFVPCAMREAASLKCLPPDPAPTPVSRNLLEGILRAGIGVVCVIGAHGAVRFSLSSSDRLSWADW
jgi:hypothetical protein